MKSIKFYAVSITKVINIIIAAIVLILCLIFFIDYISEGGPVQKIKTALSDEISQPSKLAIIIDDFGQARAGVSEFMNFERKITFAIMPFLQFSDKDLRDSLEKGHEAILHIPLQCSENDNPSWVGPHVIKVSFSSQEIEKKIQEFCDSMPGIKGANFHMGSLGSGDLRVMESIIKTVNERGLYFVDSKTNPKSKCTEAAKNIGCTIGVNRVFLEQGDKTVKGVKSQLKKAAEISVRKGSCIAIGHVGGQGGVNTIKAINQFLPELDKMNVELVYASELVEASSE